MRLHVPLLSLLFLTGCVEPTPTTTLADLNARWAGRLVTTRVAEVGQPASVTKRLDGKEGEVYRWVFDTTTATPSVPMMAPASAMTNGVYTSALVPTVLPGQVIPGSCAVDAWVKPNGIIEKMTWQGRCQ